jgi:hypothetical protein
MRYAFVVVLFGVLTSCSAVRINKSDDKRELIALSADNVNLLSARFANPAKKDSTLSGWALWANLFPKAKNHPAWSTGVVRFDILENAVKAQLVVNNVTVDDFATTYKFKKGGIILRRRWTASSIAGPLFWAVGDWRVFIGLDLRQNLVLYRAVSASGMMLVIPVFPSGGQAEFEYDRID